MYRFVLHRPNQLLVVAFGISLIAFLLVRLIPGDPARTMLGTPATATAIVQRLVRRQFRAEGDFVPFSRVGARHPYTMDWWNTSPSTDAIVRIAR